LNEILGSLAFVMDRLTGIMPSDHAQNLHDIVQDRIYSGIAPAKATYPLVVVQSLSSRDTLVVGGESAYLIADLVIKVVGQGGYEDLGEADEAIFRMLQTASGPVDDDLYVMGCYRTNTIATERSEGDTIFRTVVSTWRVRTQRIGVPTAQIA
jgi:hypothetical protein